MADLPAKGSAKKIAQKAHEHLLACRERIETGFMDLAQAIVAACEVKVWEFFGAVAPDRYFQEQLGLRPRSWRRLKAIAEAIGRLENPAEREEAKLALAKLGRHNAAVLVPLLGETDPKTGVVYDWRAWVAFATKEGTTEQVLQDAVSEVRGLPAKPAPGTPVDYDLTFREMVLSRMPEAEKSRIEIVWRLFAARQTDLASGRKVGYKESLILLFDLAQQELAAAGIEIPERL